MIFEQIRLSLVERPVTLIDVMEGRARPSVENPPVENPREDWLRKIFSQEIAFTHRKQRFHYVPDPELQADVNWIIVGRIGRKRTSKENEPPESGMRETERQAWHAMFFLIDPTSHPDGQKVAIERDAAVAQCFPILKSLIGAINRRIDAKRYIIEVQPLSEESSFWTFVGEHPEITKLTFEMIAPNMFGLHDDWDADMRELKNTENADRARFQTESKDGLKVDTPRVRKGVEHVGRGTGSLKASAKDGSKFSSQDSVKTIVTPDKDESLTWNELMKLIVARIFRV